MKTRGVKRVTTDELARMTHEGFNRMEASFREHTKVVIEEFRRLNAEVKDIKTTLGPTVMIVAEQERRLQTLESRVGRVERKVGISSPS